MKKTNLTKPMVSLVLAGLLAPLSMATAAQKERDQTSASILFGYSNNSRDSKGGNNQIRAAIRQGLANGNDALKNSFAGVHWGAVIIDRVDINDNNGDLDDHLATLNGGDVKFLNGDANGDTTSEVANDRFADMECLIVESSVNENGLATGSGSRCVVIPSQAEFLTIAHEVAHLYGASHSNGYRLASGKRTIMDLGTTENSDRVPYFSNPAVSFNGDVTGTSRFDNVRVLSTRRLEKSNRKTGLYAGQVIALQSNTGHFATGENGNSAMSASRDSVGAWEQFTVGKSGSQWTFKGSAGFISSKGGSSSGMVADRSRVRAREKFTVGIDNGSLLGRVTDYTPAFITLDGRGGFVTSNNSNGSDSVKMTANKSNAAGWESWEIWHP